jgi:hypothetical protein
MYPVLPSTKAFQGCGRVGSGGAYLGAAVVAAAATILTIHSTPLPLPGSLSTKVRKRKKGEKKEEKTKSLTQHHPFPHNKCFTPGRHRDRNFFLTHKKVFCKGNVL